MTSSVPWRESQTSSSAWNAASRSDINTRPQAEECLACPLCWGMTLGDSPRTLYPCSIILFCRGTSWALSRQILIVIVMLWGAACARRQLLQVQFELSSLPGSGVVDVDALDEAQTFELFDVDGALLLLEAR